LFYEQERGGDYPLNAQPYCPLCHEKKEKKELDFHHWNYESDTGVHLCRGCHNDIHDGQTVSEQTNAAGEGETWKDLVFENLISFHKEHHSKPPLSWSAFAVRYNLPSEYETYLRTKAFEEMFGVTAD